jgi:DNA mismatch repair protein MutS
MLTFFPEAGPQLMRRKIHGYNGIVMADQTPVMQQYQAIKNRHEDAIVLFRLGDFYEMFGEDATVASKVLQIALTTRDKNKDNPMPMCGIPHFASENYIGKLVKAGHKVAICEQVQDPREARGIVEREVVRIVTPGTFTPEHPKEHNYILGVKPSGSVHGLAFADVSTGEFFLYETDKPLEDEISGYDPREIVLPQGLADDIHYAETLKQYYVSASDDWLFDYPDAYKRLLAHFHVATLEGFGCEHMPAAISAAGALIAYLEETQKGEIHFGKMSPAKQSEFMFLDAPTQRNLELTHNLKDGGIEGSLLWALDETVTPMGGRFLRTSILRPLVNLEEIKKRHEAVKYIVEDYELIERLRRNLRNVQDIERLAQKITRASANARDLVAVKNSVSILPAIQSALSPSLNGYLAELGEAIADFSDLVALLERSIEDHPSQSLKDGGLVKAGFHEEIDELRTLSTNTRDYIASLEAQERTATGITSLKVGYNRIHGYFIEVTNSNLDQVPEHYVRRQTLVNAERFITPELKEYESKVLGAEERLKSLEHHVFQNILEKVEQWVPRLMESAGLLAKIDFLVSLAVVAKRHNYIMPHMVEEPVTNITNGRHAVIERLQLSEKFIPNNTVMEKSSRNLLIITGPNMAGKSTYMRQVALIMLMAQVGSFVPAEAATLGITDRIFTRIGASDFLTRGQSTFMVEMVETSNILNNATEQSLILLDEVGRGTSTFDGISIAWATAEHILNTIEARTLFATHYNELTDLARLHDGIANCNIAVKEWGDEIIFLRKIEPGPADKSYGIQVGRLAGLPGEVIERARQVLTRLEKQHVEDSSLYRQMDLFSSKSEEIVRELRSLDLKNMSNEDMIEKIERIKKKF